MCSLPLGDLADGVKCKLSRWPGWKGRAAVQGMEGLEDHLLVSANARCEGMKERLEQRQVAAGLG